MSTTTVAATAETLIHGTTDRPVAFDPARVYDIASWNVIYNVYPFLMRIPAGETRPEPAAAKSCAWTGKTVYRCKLREGLTFADGTPLTAEDVAFSLNRVRRIDHSAGPAGLLASLDRIATPDAHTVTFHLKRHNATWPYVLATGAAAIVPEEIYPGDAIQPNDAIVAGGPYRIAGYSREVQVRLEPNPRYHGPTPENDGVRLQYFRNSRTLARVLRQGDVDLAYPNLPPEQIRRFRERAPDGPFKVVSGEGTAIRFVAFNTRLAPGQHRAARQAAAILLDQAAIAEQVYDGTVRPLYSMVPRGVAGHVPAFAEIYGKAPDPAAARERLIDAGLQPPVPLTVWYTPSHYGEKSYAEFGLIEKQLERNDLFQVELHAVERPEYVSGTRNDKYPLYQQGWFPDFVDADNYVASFYGSKTSYLKTHYRNATIDRLIRKERQSTDRAARLDAFRRIQRIGARDAVFLPLWQGRQIAVARDSVTGLGETLGAAYRLRYWKVSITP